jgi:hypothetical protein
MWEKRDQEVGQVFATAEQALHSPQKKRVEVPKEYAELMEKIPQEDPGRLVSAGSHLELESEYITRSHDQT